MPSPPGLAPDQPHQRIRVVEEGVEDAHRIGPSADAGHHRIRQPTCAIEDLCTGLFTDDAMEVAHHDRERVGGPATVPSR